jgi:death on curing protein
MSQEREPEFLTREIIDAIHEEQISQYGGIRGLRDEGGLESAIAQGKNVYYYGKGDLYEIAAAYAFHIAESQAYLDGNKRTGAQAAIVFLEGHDIDTSRLPEIAAYEAMMKVANHEMTRSGLGAFFRATLSVD